MERIKKFLLFLFIINIGFGGLSYAQPKIPKESIPSDISPKVRKQIERLYSSVPLERAKGAHQLGKMGAKAAPAVPFLIAMFDKEYIVVDWPTVYGQAFLGDIVIRALIRIGDPAVEPLIAACSDKDPGIRWGAVATLGGIDDDRAIKPLMTALKDEDSSIRYFAAEALGRMRDKRAIEPLISMLKNKDEDRNSRREAAESLAEIGKPAIEVLIAALKDEDSTVRDIAAWVVGDKKISDSRVVEPLIAALQDKDTDIRKNAASALGSISAKQAIEPLIAALKDEDWSVRGVVISALGKIGDARAIESLFVILKDKGERQGSRRSSAEALSKMGKQGVELLVKALQDEDRVVRKNAALALGRAGDTRPIEQLIVVLQDEEYIDRHDAEWMLRKITGQNFGSDTIKWRMWWEKNKDKFRQSAKND